MKKFLGWILAALLATAILAPSAALAAPGDAAMFMIADGYAQTAYVYSAAATGDTAYMIVQDEGEDFLYAISVGQTEAQAYQFGELQEGMNIYALKLVAWDGKIVSLNYRNGKIYEIATADGKAALTERMQLDWEKMLLGAGQEKYPRDIVSMAVSGETLYVVAYDESWTNVEMLAFSLTDGSCRTVAQMERYIDELIVGRDGKLLTAISSEEDWEAPKTLCEISTEDGTLTELFELESNRASGLTYDKEQDRVIYSASGTVYATGMDGVTTDLASIPLNSYSGFSQGGVGLLDGGYYFMSGYEGTIIKNLDPEYKPSRMLTIRSVYAESDPAYVNFTEKHPEAAIRVLTGSPTADEVTQAMMNGSSEADIYLLDISSDACRALMERGYAADMSESAALSELVGRMFPVFQEALMKDGKLIAFPHSFDARGYNIMTTLAEQLGISEEEYPDTWEKLLDLVERWDESYSKEFPEKALFNPYETANMKETLFNMLLDQQVVLMNRPGAEKTVNTPTMRELLSRLDSMSFGAFASEQDFSEGYSWSSDDVLLDDWGISIPTQMYREEGKEALMLSFGEDQEALIGADMYVYVINPYSENIDLALAYLETRAETMNEGMQATLLADWTEPIRDPYFESSLKDCDRMIQNTQDALAKAGDDEKQMYESQLTELENWRKNILESEFVWTEEQLAEYREMMDHMVIVKNKYFKAYNGEAAEEMQQLISRYVDGQMSAEQMLSSLDQKLRMMEMEAGE